ncbi:reverse transcriptase (RNA-dependent DNA polymerase) domain-containing protein [Hirsutella rhossiliensis]|uniref:Reverse transcriptase (RNA-dependent DNA polymerase) domain-containing protein n=1 Tax=Hirsutella rhossiliensis TaxID=111463 RepID=A0A9P8MV92_9HYPO|nr:reverse transcriptase (RNA-dependent DNA polymerase) domain-containing protein [Hirsutella rhossiliensis]KAH0959817.1 reverse transcriptase (RNA-dependent DNA polymerase) domain-containing protein [Hirsutella rhossiliensis]
MLWIRSDLEAEQVPVPSADLTAAVLRLEGREVMVVSVSDEESTIDLVLASAELADELTSCVIHPTEHGSDHRAIQTTFDIRVPERTFPQRLMLKNAPWIAIATRVEDELRPLPWTVGVQTQADQLMRVVTKALRDLTPRAQPPPYAKRWWTKDLTRLRRTYTYWRNQARAQRRAGQSRPDLEQRAKEAAKEYHDNLRRQKKAHWDDFVIEGSNIWRAAKYLKPGTEMTDDKVPPLKRADGSITESKGEQAEELLSTFFPPLPTRIEPEGERPQREEIAMPDLTLQEIEEKVMAAKPWKAPGEDGLPAIVWKKLWHVVKHRVWTLFSSSLREGVVPHQWRTAKIIPLRKPDKGDYTLAKAWRPISLLSTLGKILEAVVAERISYAVEAQGFCPRTTLERIYKAWRTGRVLSLISFDVKGAYNGVCKERMLERMKARGIPSRLVNWIDAFCSGRTASVVVNGHTSEQQTLPQAGLPQGSPLSPVAFLFFNADLVQRRIKSNRDEKTSFIHFTRIAERDSDLPLIIKGNDVKPKSNVKLLGVIMDKALRFRNTSPERPPRAGRGHVFETTEDGFATDGEATVRRDRGASHGLCLKRVVARAVTGGSRTVATAVAEAEAGVQSFRERHAQAAAKFWIRMRTLPKTHPLTSLRLKLNRRYASPMQKLASAMGRIDTKRLEVIHEFALAPWDERVQATDETDRVEVLKSDDPEDITIATSSSQRKGKVGLGGVVRDASATA